MPEQIQIKSVEELGKAFYAFKEYNEKELSKTEATLRDELRKSSEDTLSKYDAIQKAQEENHKSIDLLSTQVNRVGNAYLDHDPAEAKEFKKGLRWFNQARRNAWKGKAFSTEQEQEVDLEAAKKYASAFERWTRYGDQSLNSDHQKALAVGSDPDGGAWIQPPEKAGYIVKRVFETTPMRQIANVVNISAHAYQIPMDPNLMPIGGWASEMQPRTQTGTASLSVKTIVPEEIWAQPPVTQIMLEDAGFDVEQYLADKAADSFAINENASYVFGNGVGKPRGFLTYPAGSNGDGSNKWGEIEQIPTGVSGNFAYLPLLRIITSFRSEKYYARARWLFKRQTVPYLMTLQDGNGRYIFQPILNGEFNQTPLLGYPMTYGTDMPALAAGALAVAFGDFQSGYTIVDRIGISTLRDPYTAKPFVLFYMRKRVGGDVVDFDAIKLLKLA